MQEQHTSNADTAVVAVSADTTGTQLVRKKVSLAMAAGDINVLVGMLEEVGVADENGHVAITPEAFMEAWQNALQNEVDAVDRTARFRMYAKAHIEAVSDEISVLQLKRKRMKDALERTDNAIVSILVARGVDEEGKCGSALNGKLYKIRAQKNPDKPEVEVEKLPAGYVRVNLTKFHPLASEVYGHIGRLREAIPNALGKEHEAAITGAHDFFVRLLESAELEPRLDTLTSDMKWIRESESDKAIPGAKWAPYSYHVRQS